MLGKVDIIIRDSQVAALIKANNIWEKWEKMWDVFEYFWAAPR